MKEYTGFTLASSSMTVMCDHI